VARNLKNEIQDLKDLVFDRKFHAIVFNDIHVAMDQRIFKRGQDSKGRQIGKYSKGYKKTRARKGYPTSNKVILQAENQMVNDFRFGIDTSNNYASGFVNPINYKKSKWVEETYKKDIFSISEKESEMLDVILEKRLKKLLS